MSRLLRRNRFSTMRNRFSTMRRRRRFSDQEDLEKEVDDIIEDVEKKEGEGIETAEDIAVLVMALDADKVAESSEAQELLGEITGLPEEGVDMIMEIKSSMEDKDEDSEKETFSAIVSGVRRAKRRFSRRRSRFSARRRFDENDVEAVADLIDDDFDLFTDDVIAESVSDLMEGDRLDREEVVEAFSRRRAMHGVRRRMSRGSFLRRRSLSRRSKSFSGLSRLRSGRMSRRRLYSRSSLGSLVPTRTESMGIRKIDNDRSRYQTVRPRDPRDISAGYKGERFSSRRSESNFIGFLNQLAGK